MGNFLVDSEGASCGKMLLEAFGPMQGDGRGSERVANDSPLLTCPESLPKHTFLFGDFCFSQRIGNVRGLHFQS